jgi:hypothetical protein
MQITKDKEYQALLSQVSDADLAASEDLVEDSSIAPSRSEKKSVTWGGKHVKRIHN